MSLDTFIGTKIIQATPMNRKEYNDFRGWELPKDENGDDAGYLVIYPDSNPNTSHYQGYVSWSPKKQFDDAYLTIGKVDHLEPFQQRLLGEFTLLKDMLKKLKKFIGSPNFFKLDFFTRSKLEEQSRHMNAYKTVLAWRTKDLQMK